MKFSSISIVSFSYRFEVQPPEDLSESERESYTMDVIIPVQLR